MSLLIILGCVVCSKGFGAAWDMISDFVLGTLDLIRVLVATAVHFPDELGITDWLLEKGILFGITTFLFIAFGYVLSPKEQKKLGGTISAVLGIISSFLMFT